MFCGKRTYIFIGLHFVRLYKFALNNKMLNTQGRVTAVILFTDTDINEILKHESVQVCDVLLCDQAHGRVRHAENRPGDESDSGV